MLPSDDLKLRALAVTTRRRLFEILEQAPAPLSVAELAEALAVHQNTVRLHLDVLMDASLVESTGAASSSGRGRPSVRYRAIDAGWPDDSSQRPYERLATWLASAVSPAAARHAGEAIGATVGSEHGVDGLVALLDAEGFDPVVDDSGAIVLSRCPFAAVAAVAPSAVCALHQGIVDGAVGDDRRRRLRLMPHDPHRGGCTIALRRDG